MGHYHGYPVAKNDPSRAKVLRAWAGVWPRADQRLIEETCERQKIAAGRLTIHADRGTSMTSKPVALLSATSA